MSERNYRKLLRIRGKKKEKEKDRGKSVIVLLNDEGTISILAAKCRSVPWLSSIKELEVLTLNKNKMKEHKF